MLLDDIQVTRDRAAAGGTGALSLPFSYGRFIRAFVFVAFLVLDFLVMDFLAMAFLIMKGISCEIGLEVAKFSVKK